MEFKIDEGDKYFGLTMKPENVDEYSMLLRLAEQAKRDPIQITMNFGNIANATIYIKRVDPKQRKYYITNKKKKGYQ